MAPVAPVGSLGQHRDLEFISPSTVGADWEPLKCQHDQEKCDDIIKYQEGLYQSENFTRECSWY